jgi:signal peptidase
VNSQTDSRQTWGRWLAGCAGFVLVAVLALAVAVGGVPLAVQGRALSVYRDSMTPAFGRGDVIVIRGVKEPAAIEPGQIISYRTGGAGSPVATRRVVGQTAEGLERRWIVQSDADQVREEDAVADDQIVGVYMYRIPKLGHAVSWASEHGIAVIVVGLGAVLALAAIVLVVALRRQSRSQGRSEPPDEDAGRTAPRHTLRGAGSRGRPALQSSPASTGDEPGRGSAPAKERGAEEQPPAGSGSGPGRTPGTGPAAPAAPLRKRAEAKRSDLVDTLTGAEIRPPRPVPWRPGPGASNDRPPARSRQDVPTWDDVAAGPPRPAPRVERLVSTRPETLVKPVAFVPKGPAMEGHSSGELPVRQPRLIADDPSLPRKIPHARVPVHPTEDMPPVPLLSEDALLVPSPPPSARRSGAPIAARIPRAQTPPGPPPPLPAVRIERAVPFGQTAGPAPVGELSSAGRIPATRSERMGGAPPAEAGQTQAAGPAFEQLKRRAAQVMHESGELRLVREGRKPSRIARSGGPSVRE